MVDASSSLTMIEHRLMRFLALVIFCSTAWAFPAVPAIGEEPHEQKNDTQAIAPNALDLLRQSTNRINALSKFTVRAEATRDVLVRDGYKVQTTIGERITVQHNPDRMRAETWGDEGRRIYVYDGKTVRIYAGPENYYADLPGDDTLARTYENITNKYGIDFPLDDFLYAATGGDLARGVTEAGVVGRTRIAGVECDHLAFRSPKIDFQFWIDRTRNLPRKIVMTTRDDP